MIKTRVIIITLFLLFLVLPISASAFAVKTDDAVFIAAGEVIEGNLYAVGNTISIDGRVTGDVICGAQTININGSVDGDVICGAQTININGPVGGSVRVGGNSININSAVERNVQAFGASINLGTGGSVGWDMLVAGANVEIRGKVGGDLHGGAANVVISGEVGKNVKLKLDDKMRSEKKGWTKQDDKSTLQVTNSAVIGGSLTYTSGSGANIADGASISGEVIHKTPKVKDFKQWNYVTWLWGKLFLIFSSLVIGLVLITLFRKPILKLTDRMLEKIGAAIGWGAVVMFLTPVIFVLLLFTMIGIPLAFLLLAVWVMALFISKIMVGIMVGRAILDKIWHKKKDSLIWAMIIGVIITYFIFSIPIIGWLLVLIAIWWGLGGIWLYLRNA